VDDTGGSVGWATAPRRAGRGVREAPRDRDAPTAADPAPAATPVDGQRDGGRGRAEVGGVAHGCTGGCGGWCWRGAS